MINEKKKLELKRVNMNLPANLVRRVVEYGEEMGLNTTSAYIVLLNQALDQKDTMKNLPAIMQMGETLKNLKSDLSDNLDD